MHISPLGKTEELCLQLGKVIGPAESSKDAFTLRIKVELTHYARHQKGSNRVGICLTLSSMLSKVFMVERGQQLPGTSA